MPVTIGAKRESDFSDPLGMLSDCHRRIERFLHALIVVAGQAQGGSLTSEQRAALEGSLRYFREAAPKHTADEEQSLFPLLRRVDRADREPLLERIASLEKDHCWAVIAHNEVERLGQMWLANGMLLPREAAKLSVQLASLAELYQRHIDLEDNDVFPAAATILSAADRARIGTEMAARRGVRRQ